MHNTFMILVCENTLTLFNNNHMQQHCSQLLAFYTFTLTRYILHKKCILSLCYAYHMEFYVMICYPYVMTIAASLAGIAAIYKHGTILHK